MCEIDFDKDDMLVSVYLQEINNSLIKQRDIKRKPEFPYQKNEVMSEKDCDNVLNEVKGNNILIKSLEEGNSVFGNLIKGEYKMSSQQTLNIMVKIWNYFFSFHYEKWQMTGREWRIANTWLNWMQDYDFCFVGGEQKYLDDLDCNVQVKDKNKVVDYINPLYGKLDDVIRKIDNLTNALTKANAEEIENIERRFEFPVCCEKVYANVMYQMFIEEDKFYKYKGGSIRQSDMDPLGQIYGCILVALAEKLKPYGVDFEKISQGIELYPIEKQEVTLFDGLRMTSREKKEMLEKVCFKPNTGFVEYRVENEKVFLINKNERKIEKGCLYELTKYIAKYMRKYICYWNGDNISYAVDLNKIAKKINILGINKDVLEAIRKCVYDITLNFFMLAEPLDFRVRKQMKEMKQREIRKRLLQTEEFISTAKEKIIENYFEDNYYEKVKEKLALYDKWVGLSGADCVIVQAILVNPSCTMKEIEDLSWYSFDTIAERFERLERKGLLLPKRNSVWRFDVD